MNAKLLFFSLMPLLVFSSGFAHDPRRVVAGAPLVEENEWTPVQVSLWPVKLFSDRPVYGVNLSPGLLSYQERVYGVSLSVMGGEGELCGFQAGMFCFALDRSTGLMVGMGNYCRRNRGVMVGLFNLSLPDDSDDGDGTFENFLQLGLVNQAENGLQLGLVNYNPNALIPWMPLINFSLREEAAPAP